MTTYQRSAQAPSNVKVTKKPTVITSLLGLTFASGLHASAGNSSQIRTWAYTNLTSSGCDLEITCLNATPGKPDVQYTIHVTKSAIITTVYQAQESTPTLDESSFVVLALETAANGRIKASVSNF